MCVDLYNRHQCSGKLTGYSANGEAIHVNCERMACNHYAGGTPVNDGNPEFVRTDICDDRRSGRRCTLTWDWNGPAISHKGAPDWYLYMCTICYTVKGPLLSTLNHE